jgi:protein-S-isoprenylcysteine O-methyltransferase
VPGPAIAIGCAALVAVVGGFAERLLIREDRAEAKNQDKGSIFPFAFAMSVGMGGAFFVSFVRVPYLPIPVSIAGLAIGLAGVVLRVWSIRVLGRYFTRTVQVSNDQPVIDHGPYRLVRHPSYTALLLWVFGFGLALATIESMLLATLPMLGAILWRTRIEEAALLAEIGEPYRAYCKRTKRFIPWLY